MNKITAEKIISIEEISNYKSHGVNKFFDSYYDGYKITTDKQEIFVGIDNSQYCCEEWGYCSSLDNFDDFIGADLLTIVSVDTALKTYELDRSRDGYDVLDEAMFINFETSKGTFQIVCYNSHNGYYGHDVVVISNQLAILEDKKK